SVRRSYQVRTSAGSISQSHEFLSTQKICIRQSLLAAVRIDILACIFLIDEVSIRVKVVHWMRVVLKNLMRRNHAIFNPLWAFLYPLIYRCDVKYFGSENLNGPRAFLTIFEENRWGSSESRSGPGSTVAYTKRLGPLLERYEGYSFQTIDIVEGPLPNADLWLWRDVFFQLPSQDIQQVMLPPPLS